MTERRACTQQWEARAVRTTVEQAEGCAFNLWGIRSQQLEAEAERGEPASVHDEVPQKVTGPIPNHSASSHVS
jgi:hypothetical protein